MSSLHEAERRRQQADRDRAVDDDRVMTFRQWCEVNNFSASTGRRLIRSGKGPKIVQLSPRRIGITVRANREWQASLERP